MSLSLRSVVIKGWDRRDVKCLTFVTSKQDCYVDVTEEEWK